ncbi:MAG: thioesterase family protein [Myxococcales bacterium]|nr:thioesterase family protein [Myxococcales bacterium]MDD9965088.1 thioesterase family protein [Myxococcales bacterium]
MVGLKEATEVEGEGGRYQVPVDGDWCVWSPAGGYLMALALRAGGQAAHFPLPLSLSCHFLSAPKLEAVDLQVTSQRRTRVAESLRIAMTQRDKPVLEMLLWAGERVDGYQHVDAKMPEVPGREDLEPRVVEKGPPGFQTLWSNLEHRPCGPLHWQHDDLREPRQRDWVRLREFPDDPDPFLDAARSALVLDCFTWPAAAHAHAGDGRFIAPTIALTVDFHRYAGGQWLLSDAYAPVAREGRIAIHNRVFTPEGELAASAHGTLICRPRPQR